MDRSVLRCRRSWRVVGSLALRFGLPLCLAWTGSGRLGAAPAEVRFDVGRLVACRDVTTEEFAAANPEECLLQAKLEISSLVTRGDGANPLEHFYQFTFPHRRLQIADYQPRTVAGSDYAGNIGVERHKESTRSAGLAVSGGWEYFANVTGSGDAGSKQGTNVRFELVPQQEVVAASGTMQRGCGVYFKLKRMRQSLLEGSKEFVITFRAPRSWRGDYVHVRCRATGVQRSAVRQFEEEVSCGEANFIVALYLEGDEAAKRAASRLSDTAMELSRSAARNQEQIRKHNYPTVFHEFGALLGAVEPKISDGWLTEVIYLPQQGRLQQITQQLPGDVRQAASNYLAARDAMRRLESDAASPSPR